MRNLLASTISFLKILFSCFPVFLFLLQASSLAFAVTGPLSEEVTVSATVPDNSPPTTPILVSPTNNSYVTDSTPTFVWEESTDTNGISHYEMSLDGSGLFTSIPTTATSNSEYVLTFDSVLDRYSLTPVDNLTQGLHTWKIRAVDNAGIGTDSATWSFTIDTQAPAFVMTNLGDQVVNISAQDLGTIPSEPIELGANEPLLSGTGEANSSVSLTVTIPDDPTQNFSFSIDSSGNWSQQLGILPRDVVMILTFTITDVAGNLSTLSDVEFIIPTATIVFPPATPTPTPDVVIPGEATPTPSTEATPLVEIPIIPPREIINEVVQETMEDFQGPISVLTSILPTNLVQTVETIAQDLAPISSLVAASAVPTLSLFALAGQFGGNLSFSIIVRILQALGLIPAGKPQGVVYNSATYEPIPFALLTINSVDINQNQVQETVVTDTSGIYRGIKLALGKYRLLASHQEFTFPTKIERPRYLSFNDFYKGEEFQVTSEKNEQLFLIPMDPLSESTKKDIKTRFKIFLSRLAKFSKHLVFPMFVVSGLLAVIFPTLWNWLVFAIYVLIMIRKAAGWFKVPLLTGQVIDMNGQPLPNVVVRVSLVDQNELLAVTTTNEQGYWQTMAKPGNYQVTITKPDYILINQGAALAFTEIKLADTPQHLVMSMQEASRVYQELFG